MSTTTLPPDPRPQVVARDGRHVLAGGRCRACGHAIAFPRPRCPRCAGEVLPADFGPAGTVWASTFVHLGDAPYALAYVDLDDGPRLLARVPGATAAPAVGARVALTAPTAAGHPAAEVGP